MTSYQVQVERVWYLYRIYDAGRRLLYIGQTGRNAITRWTEHIADQWWAGDICYMERQILAYSSLAAVRAAEKAAIETELPLHNVEHNLNNPHRIIGPPHGVYVQRRGGRPARVPAAPVRRSFWTRRRITWAALASVWLAAFSALWWATAAKAGVRIGLDVTTVLMVVLSIAAYRSRPKRRRRRWR